MNETDLSQGVSDAEFSVVERWAAALNDMTPAEFIELAEKRRAVLFRSARRDLIREGLLDLMPREREAEIFRRLSEREKGVEDDHPSPAGPSRSAELDNFVESFLSLDKRIGMSLVDVDPSPAGPSRSAEMFSELIERLSTEPFSQLKEHLSEASKDPLGRWHRPPPRRRHRPQDPGQALEGAQSEVPAPPDDDRSALYRQLQVSSQDIAWLATTPGEEARGRSKPPSLVSHWRKGADRFPEAVVAGRSPRFRLDEVLKWMRDRDKLGREPSSRWLWRHSIQLLPPLAQANRANSLRPLVTGLVATVAKFQDGHTAPASELDDEQVIDSALEWTDGNPFRNPDDLAVDLSGVLLALRIALYDSPEERVLENGLDALSTFTSSEHATSEPLARLLARLALAGAPEDASLIDLGCGEGRVLTQVLDHDENQRVSQIRGLEIHEETVRIARRRLELQDPGSEGCIEQTDAFGELTESFDIVIVDPPAKGIANWTSRCTSLLEPTASARGFLVAPARDLSADGAICTTTLCRNIEAVILLPPGLRPHTKGPQALCVLTGEDRTQDRILVIDVSDRTLVTGPGAPPFKPNGRLKPTGRAEISCTDLTEALDDWRRQGRVDVSELEGRWESLSSAQAQVSGFGPVKPDLPASTLEAITRLQSELAGLPYGIEAYGRRIAELQKRVSRVVSDYEVD
tara:strand:- start:958 stop:3024 length:2067 start_codon:yes stop_codon:yes gene_type:complete